MSQKPDNTYEAVIAARDMEHYVGETIQSLLDSTIPPEAIWVVDDASSDDTGRIAQSYDRVNLLVNKENKDTSYSRNRAIKKCTSPFILVIDADDIVHPYRIKHQMAYLEANPDVDAVYSDKYSFQGILSDTSQTKKEDVSYIDDLLEHLIIKNILVPSLFLFRKRFFYEYGFFDQTIHISNDRELLIRALLKGAVIRHTPGAITYYRRHNTSMLSTRYREGIYNNALTLQKHFNELLLFEHGTYRQPLVNSMRMTARNLNIYQYPFELVHDFLERIDGLETPAIQQNVIYKSLERLLGANRLERLLRLKFRLDYKLGRLDEFK